MNKMLNDDIRYKDNSKCFLLFLSTSLLDARWLDINFIEKRIIFIVIHLVEWMNKRRKAIDIQNNNMYNKEKKSNEQ
jgi:hypothetical protein